MPGLRPAHRPAGESAQPGPAPSLPAAPAPPRPGRGSAAPALPAAPAAAATRARRGSPRPARPQRAVRAAGGCLPEPQGRPGCGGQRSAPVGSARPLRSLRAPSPRALVPMATRLWRLVRSSGRAHALPVKHLELRKNGSADKSETRACALRAQSGLWFCSTVSKRVAPACSGKTRSVLHVQQKHQIRLSEDKVRLTRFIFHNGAHSMNLLPCVYYHTPQ